MEAVIESEKAVSSEDDEEFNVAKFVKKMSKTPKKSDIEPQGLYAMMQKRL